jgi:hypothetical protein
MKDRPNTTQRSWSNYVGDNPIERNRGTDFYRDSWAYGPRGGASQSVPEGYEIDPATGGMRRKRNTRLNKARSDMGGTAVEGTYDPSTSVV